MKMMLKVLALPVLFVVKSICTLTCIAGSIAEGFYGVPLELKEECRKRIPEGFREVLDRVDEYIADKN